MKRNRSKTYLWIFSLTFFVICIMEGVIFYHRSTDGTFLRVAMNIQNAIKAFKLDTDIKINDAMKLMNESQFHMLESAITYLYVVAVIGAPFCTVAAVAMLVKRPLYFVEGLVKRMKKKRFLIFGHGQNKERFLEAIRRECRVTVLEDTSVLDETTLQYLKQGVTCIIAGTDVDNAKLLKKMKLNKADYVLFCDDDPLTNLTFLNHAVEFMEQSAARHRDTNTVYYLQCDDFNIGEVVKSSRMVKKLTENNIDLQLVDIKQKAVTKMFSDYKIYSYNNQSGSKDVHLAIAGFGDFGQNALLQAMNLGVFSGDSSIVIDVFDKNMKHILGSFLKHFSVDVLEELQHNVPVEAGTVDYLLQFPNEHFHVDGTLTLRFWNVNTNTLLFNRLIENCIREQPFTYVVLALKQEQQIIATLLEINKLMWANDSNYAAAPLVVRTTGSSDSFAFLSTDKRFENVKMINQRKDIYSLQVLQNNDIVNNAKLFNSRYSQVSASNLEIDEEALKKESEAQWFKMSLFKRESSIAQSLHQDVKRWLIKDRKEALSLEEQGKLEHRRWDLFMIASGYHYAPGKKDDERKHNDCLCTWEELKQTRPDAIEYDYTPYKLLK